MDPAPRASEPLLPRPAAPPTLPPVSGAPKLLDRVRAEIRRRHYSRRTEKAYVSWIRRYVIFHGKRHPNDLGAAELTSFLSHLATAANVVAHTDRGEAVRLISARRATPRERKFYEESR